MVIIKENKAKLKEGGLTLLDLATDSDFLSFRGARIEGAGPFPRSSVDIQVPLKRNFVDVKKNNTVEKIQYATSSKGVTVNITAFMKIGRFTKKEVMVYDQVVYITFYR